MDKDRYSRQLILPQFGEEGQRKLLSSSVLVVGAGGLGSPVLLYLTAAGVGKIGIVEDDNVALSNLQRQILFSTDDVGKSKAEQAKRRLNALNPDVSVQLFQERLTAQNALELVRGFDLVIDSSDNFQTRYLVNDACVLESKPFIFGAIHQFEGQVAVFNLNGSATYRDVFPEPPTPEMAPNCAEAGVLGVMGGLVGSHQALEALKILAGVGETLANKLLLLDAISGQSRIIKIKKNENAPKITQLIDYESFCGVSFVNEIDLLTLKKWQNEGVDFQLIDVRESNEYAIFNLGGENKPLSGLERFVGEIDRVKKVVVHCQSGVRSKKAIRLLEENHGFRNLINLKNGLA